MSNNAQKFAWDGRPSSSSSSLRNGRVGFRKPNRHANRPIITRGRAGGQSRAAALGGDPRRARRKRKVRDGSRPKDTAIFSRRADEDGFADRLRNCDEDASGFPGRLTIFASLFSVVGAVVRSSTEEIFEMRFRLAALLFRVGKERTGLHSLPVNLSFFRTNGVNRFVVTT